MFLDHARFRERSVSVRGYALHSYLDYSRMEFTRGPKCSPKYFIIEILQRWVIKLEGTSARDGAKARCVACARELSVSPLVYACTRTAARPRNHRGRVEILSEYGFMTVSSVYAREEDRGAIARRARGKGYTEREQEVSKGT